MDTRQPEMSPGEATYAPARSAEEEIREAADTVRVGVPGARPRARIVMAQPRGARGRVAIVAGARTPFQRAGSGLAGVDVLGLAATPAAETVARSGVDPEEIGAAIFGVVIPALQAPNLGREVVLRTSLPRAVPGTTVNLACASACRAITSGAEAILSGQCDTVLAGGAESLSNVPIRFSDRAARAFQAMAKARSLGAKAAALARLRPRDLAPVAPAIAEYSTGLRMGDSAEIMARENGVTRQAQDEIAWLSHRRAAAAAAEGIFAEQISPVHPPRGGATVREDNGIRSDSTREALAALPPVFDRRYGTLTAGNSSPITDGGSAVLLMAEERVRELGLTPLGYIRSWAYAALDPAGQLLQGPAYAAPAALEAAGVGLADVDLVEMHEAFAAQVLSNLKALASPRFAREELGREQPVGVVDLEKLNVYGGSIAIGHPFGATGGRIVIQLLDALARRDGELGLATVCAAGGVGFAMVLERR